ncbi:hypothetical protein Poly30_29080 [Planctomycetes bacterium Poly30]|uniref:Peptidase S24-like protein n=1 Tax=Saltatorellus ferox TaxID=2528018 RepID=A0A518ETG5_9BACT|nr:hypothetical protein Poly30_29080 [Planctomycetes bacterium Poly30]
MTDPRATLKRQRSALKLIRRYTVLAALVGLVYIATRFEFSQLPVDRCCPLVRFAPGDRLVIDGRPGDVSVDDAVLIQTQSGAKHLCRVERLRPEDGRLWCVTDNADCAGFSSETAGWIDPRAVTGRVLLSWEY